MIKWKLLQAHAENYDGTCKYCGGICECDEAVDMRIKVLSDLNRLRNYSCSKYVGLSYTYKTLRAKYNSTLTYRFN